MSRVNYTYFQQHTIGREVVCSGVGLHSGAKVSMKLKPAPANFGIRFRRMDVCGQPVIDAHHHRVVDTFQATTIGFDGVVVATIEHVMAAFLGAAIDNVLVELDGPEVPIFDGSAAPFLRLLWKAGTRRQNSVRNCLSIDKTILLKDGEAYIKAVPSDGFRVHYAIEYPHPLVGKQEFLWAFDEDGFARDIAGARTFGFLKDVQKLQNMGRAQGGSLDNAVVFDDRGLLNQGGFRYSDECVRHKILDFMGDLALMGMPIIGYFEVFKAGHTLHRRFIEQLTASPGCCTVSRAASLPARIFHTAPLASFAGGFPQMVKTL
jgi:UDP-3-O-[3-hydroxymyristoyl] N-acetylglucosamine deacetylase